MATWNQPTGDQLLGTQTNDSATIGNVGEYISFNLPLSSQITLTASLPSSLGGIAIGGGDWDIVSQVNVTLSVSTSAGPIYSFACISSISTAVNTTNGFCNQSPGGTLAGTGGAGPGVGPLTGVSLYVGPVRVSVSACTSYFMLAQSDKAHNANGIIQARRVR